MSVKIIECPRDAMQGIKTWIPTDAKIRYMNQLLKAGFDTLDFGSFVSAVAVPQMADTVQVLSGLELDTTNTKLLAIVANSRGASEAIAFDEITYLGYPFSLSETFQQRNTRRSVESALELVAEIQDMCFRTRKQLVVYLSMGFGNPYGDPWSADMVMQYTEKMQDLGVGIVSLADTTGSADASVIQSVFSQVMPAFPDMEIGAHFHAQPHNWRAKVEAAYASGCRRFDGAIKGFGGCPFASDNLTGNIATENLLSYLAEQKAETGVDADAMQACVLAADAVFSLYH